MSNKKPLNLLIAGSAGLIGSACLRLIKKDLYNVFSPDKKTLNYLDFDKFYNYCKSNEIDYIIFAVGKVGEF